MKRGAIAHQQPEGRGIGILNPISHLLQYEGAKVWFDLGLCKVRMISNNPGKLQALKEAELEIVEGVSIEVETHPSYAASCGLVLLFVEFRGSQMN